MIRARDALDSRLAEKLANQEISAMGTRICTVCDPVNYRAVQPPAHLAAAGLDIQILARHRVAEALEVSLRARLQTTVAGRIVGVRPAHLVAGVVAVVQIGRCSSSDWSDTPVCTELLQRPAFDRSTRTRTNTQPTKKRSPASEPLSLIFFQALFLLLRHSIRITCN